MKYREHAKEQINRLPSPASENLFSTLFLLSKKLPLHSDLITNSSLILCENHGSRTHTAVILLFLNFNLSVT